MLPQARTSCGWPTSPTCERWPGSCRRLKRQRVLRRVLGWRVSTSKHTSPCRTRCNRQCASAVITTWSGPKQDCCTTDGGFHEDRLPVAIEYEQRYRDTVEVTILDAYDQPTLWETQDGSVTTVVPSASCRHAWRRSAAELRMSIRTQPLPTSGARQSGLLKLLTCTNSTPIEDHPSSGTSQP